MSRSLTHLFLFASLACTTSGCMGIMGGGGMLNASFPDCVDACGHEPGIGNGGLIDHMRANRIERIQARRDRMNGCRNNYAHQVAAPYGDCGSRVVDCGSSIIDCGSSYIDCGSSHCGMPLNCGMPMVMGGGMMYDGMEMDGQMMGDGPYFDGMSSGGDCQTCQSQGSFPEMMSGQPMIHGQPMMYGTQQSMMVPTPASPMDAPAPPSMNPTPARPIAPHDPNAKDEYLAPRMGPQSNMYYQNGMPSYSGMMPQQVMPQQMMMQPQMMPQQMMQSGMVQGNMMQGNIMPTSGMMQPQMMSPQMMPQQMQSQMPQQMSYPVQQTAGVPAIQAF